MKTSKPIASGMNPGKPRFNAADLSVLAYANNFTLWHYVSHDDTLEEISEPGYFNNARDMMRSRDKIIINARDMDADAFIDSNGADIIIR